MAWDRLTRRLPVLYAVGREGKLVMDGLSVTGMARTRSTEGVVTDSAAAGTALSTGVKTYNKAIAVDPDKKPVPTILEKAARDREIGWTGDQRLVVACNTCLLRLS